MLEQDVGGWIEGEKDREVRPKHTYLVHNSAIHGDINLILFWSHKHDLLACRQREKIIPILGTVRLSQVQSDTCLTITSW
jgi:hypothetical protein